MSVFTLSLRFKYSILSYTAIWRQREDEGTLLSDFYLSKANVKLNGDLYAAKTFAFCIHIINTYNFDVVLLRVPTIIPQTSI